MSFLSKKFRLTVLVLVSFGFSQLSVFAKAEQLNSLETIASNLEFVSGSLADLKIGVHGEDIQIENSGNLPTIRLFVDPKNLATKEARSIKVLAYEGNTLENKTFVSSTTIAVTKINKIQNFEITLNKFDSTFKNIFFEVYNSKGELINTYKKTFEIDTPDQNTSETIANAECTSFEFGDCQLAYLLSRINFELDLEHNNTTRINKDLAGNYKITIPANFQNSAAKGAVDFQNTKPIGLNDFDGTDGNPVNNNNPTNIFTGVKADGVFLSNTTFDGDITVKNAKKNTVMTIGDDGKVKWVPINTLQTTSTTQIIQNTQFVPAPISQAPSSVVVPSSTITVNANTSIAANSILVKIQGTTALTDILSVPQIAAGTDGQMLTLLGMSNANKVHLDDGDGLMLSDDYDMGLGDAITLTYDITIQKWIEISRSDKAEDSGENTIGPM